MTNGTFRVLLIVSLLLAASSAAALDCSVGVFAVEPVRPTTDDVVRLHVSGGCFHSCRPHSPRVEITSSGATVHFSGNDQACLTTPSAFGEWIELGRLRAGTHEIVLMWGKEELARKTITVTSPEIVVQPRFGAEGSSVALTVRGAPAEPPRKVTIGGAEVPFGPVEASSTIVYVPKLPAGVHDVSIEYPSTTITADDAFEYTTSPDPSHFTKVLFPLAFVGFGAFESHWRTDNWIVNDSLLPLQTNIAVQPIAPRARLALPAFDTNRGLVVGVARDLIEQTWFASHVRDMSRFAANAGTELPVIREHDTRQHLMIPGVRIDPRFRYQLRVYDIDGIDRFVFVQIRTSKGAGAAVFTELHTQTRCITAPCITNEPAYAALDLGPLLKDLGVEEADLELTATIGDARIWAFVSATNNETQHVTAYTPQR